MKTELDSAPPDGVEAEIDVSAQTSAFTSARMSGPRQRIEVITGAERRRRWSGIVRLTGSGRLVGDQ